MGFPRGHVRSSFQAFSKTRGGGGYRVRPGKEGAKEVRLRGREGACAFLRVFTLLGEPARALGYLPLALKREFEARGPLLCLRCGQWADRRLPAPGFLREAMGTDWGRQGAPGSERVHRPVLCSDRPVRPLLRERTLAWVISQSTQPGEGAEGV